MTSNQFLVNGDSTRLPFKDGLFQLCVTSPPYMNLRDYNSGEHEIGREPTVAEYVEAMRIVGKEVWRVLRNDGVFILNIADSRNKSGGAGGDYNTGGLREGQKKYKGVDDSRFQAGDLLGIPWRTAIALQEDGWNSRHDIIWNKNSIPEPREGWRWTRHNLGKKQGYKDCPGCKKCDKHNGYILKRASYRPTYSKEYIFVFAKQMGYYGDKYAIVDASGSNPRDVMTFSGTPYKGDHQAPFPTTLPEFFIRAYTPLAGSCSICGTPWARVIERRFDGEYNDDEAKKQQLRSDGVQSGGTERVTLGRTEHVKVETLDWWPSCEHVNAPAVPAKVLDPFIGTGSTAVAAKKLQRDCVGVDLNFKYLIEDARSRLGENDGQQSLF